MICKEWKIKPFISKHNCERINFPSEKDNTEKFEKNKIAIVINVLDAKKEYILLMFQNITQTVKNKLFFYFKWRKTVTVGDLSYVS